MINKYSEYIVFSVLLIIGLLLIVAQEKLTLSAPVANALGSISSTLLIGGILGFLYKKYIDQNHYEEIKKILSLSKSMEDSGLLEFHREHKTYRFENLIHDSNSLTIVFNDGLGWVKNNTDELRKRFKRHGETKVFIIDPEGVFVPAIAKKVNYSHENYRNKLITSRNQLEQLHQESNKKGSLEIYHLKNFPTKTIFLTEKYLVITPYQVSSKRVNVPVLVFDSTNPEQGMMSEFNQDFELIQTESTRVYP